MTTLHTAGGIELLIWIAFIIISMVAQAAKSAKKVKDNRPTQEPSRAPTPHLDPQQELEEFLESLSRGGPAAPPEAEEPEPRPQPAPPPPVVRPRQTPRAPTPPSLPPVIVPAPTPAMAPQPVVPLSPAARSRPQRDINYVTVDPEDVEAAYYEKLREEIQSDLHDRHTLRKAVLLQEILNPPLALRKSEF